jgi:hypothetical protein
MTLLSVESLDFAKQHLTSFWDSDFFPKAYEFDSLWAQWAQVKEHLATTPMDELDVVLPRIMAAPKPDGGYRLVHQLDPLNAIAYTAMAYHITPSIEAARPPIDEHVACSYRLAIDASMGRFFGDNNGYSAFAEQSRNLAASHEHVFVADITDFYNQIYLHRLQNAVSSADPTFGGFATHMERFLTRLNDGVSRGVPVGPVASIVMSEAVLLDIDAFISGRGFRHTRYVDDIRVFADDLTLLRVLQQDLTRYLHSSHRLVFASGKTSIMGTATFRDTILDEPEEVERRTIHRELSRIRRLNRYEMDDPGGEPDIPTDARQRVEALKALMDRVCALSALDLGLARHVLRRCRRYEIRAIVPQLLERLDHFVPVMNDVVLYLRAVANRGMIARNHEALLRALSSRAILDVEWARYWAAHLVVRTWPLLSRPEFQRYVAAHGDLESQAFAALQLRNVAWVRQQRARIDEIGGWPRRQVLRAGLALAADERRHWYRNLLANNRPGAERWLLPWLISQP